MSDVAVRYLTMLRAVPFEPKSVTARELVVHLTDEGYEVGVRSVQRDLERLSRIFPLQCDDRSRPFGWYFGKDANLSIIPSIDSSTALTLQLTRAYLGPVMPPRILQKLQPHFDAAQRSLDRQGDLAKWPARVRVITRGLGVQVPEIAADVLEVVAEALLSDSQCLLVYQGRRWPEPESITVHPYGLVFRSPNIYLICTIEGREGIRQLVLHRASSAELLSSPTAKLDFDLDEYIDNGNMGVLISKTPVEIRLRCDKPMLNHLVESPLSDDQLINDLDNTQFELSATLRDTQDLRWWLTAQASHLDIVEPQWLREEICSELKKGLGRNGGQAGEASSKLSVSA